MRRIEQASGIFGEAMNNGITVHGVFMSIEGGRHKGGSCKYIERCAGGAKTAITDINFNVMDSEEY